MIFAAARKENPEVVKLLIGKGAETDVTDGNGISAWDYVKQNPDLRESTEYGNLEELFR